MVFAPYSGIGYDKQKAIQDLMTIREKSGTVGPGAPAPASRTPSSSGFALPPGQVPASPQNAFLDFPIIQSVTGLQVLPLPVTPAQEALAQLENALYQGNIPSVDDIADALAALPLDLRDATLSQVRNRLVSTGPEGQRRAQQVAIEMEIRSVQELRRELAQVSARLEAGSEEQRLLQTRLAALGQMSVKLLQEKSQLLAEDASAGGVIDLPQPAALELLQQMLSELF